MLILSFDPGKTTGVALIETHNSSSFQLVWAMQVENGLKGFLDFYWDEIYDQIDPDVIVCEDFVLRHGVAGANITPAFVIGAMEASFIGEKIFYQSPSLKSLCDDERLKKLGIYTKNRPHANDAVRHGVIYLRNRYNAYILEKGWGNDG